MDHLLRIMKGCLSASAGVHLFSGLRFKHRSSRSTNMFSSFNSVVNSFMPFELVRSLVLRSRVGFVKLKIRITSLGHLLAYSPSCEAPCVSTYLARQLVLLDTPEVEEIVKVQAGELGTP